MSKPSNSHRSSLPRGGIRRRLQCIAFATLYRYGGRIYDRLTVVLFGGAWARWRMAIVPYLGDGIVLDLGCGTGAFMETLVARGLTVFGIDRSSSMLGRARARAFRRSRLVQGDATRLPFMTGTFASCVATFPADFILRPATLDEIARVLRPGGTFAVVLSGYAERRSITARPIQYALQLFYGERSTLPSSDVGWFEHELFAGEFKRIENGEDHIFLWVGHRSAGDQMNDNN